VSLGIAFVLLVVVGLSNYNATTGESRGGNTAMVLAIGAVMVVGVYLAALAGGFVPQGQARLGIGLAVTITAVALGAGALMSGGGPPDQVPVAESCGLTLTNAGVVDVVVEVEGPLGSCQRVRDSIGSIGAWSTSSYPPGSLGGTGICYGGSDTVVTVAQAAGDYALSAAVCQRLGLKPY
jgi:hypothetical protein